MRPNFAVYARVQPRGLLYPAPFSNDDHVLLRQLLLIDYVRAGTIRRHA